MAVISQQALHERMFPTGAAVVALPNWSHPRLYVAAPNMLARWRAASLYPAYRRRARLLRHALRARAACACAARRTDSHHAGDIAVFIDRHWPGAAPAALLVGTASPVQKFTAQVRDARGSVVGYVKLAQQAAARQRLRDEHDMLAQLPPGLGPRAIALETLGDVDALALTPIAGRAVPPRRTLNRGMQQLLASLHTSRHASAAEHPWLIALQEQADIDLKPWIAALGSQRWPIVIQHGDLTPWNLLRKTDGSLALIDWEEGCMGGMAHVDLAHLLLQTGMLIQRWSPKRTLAHAIATLQQRPWPALEARQAEAILRLAAYEKHRVYQLDGIADDFAPQQWRRQLWEARA